MGQYNLFQLYDVFELMQKHVASTATAQSLGCIKQFWGKDKLNAPLSYPAVIWIPTNDSFSYGDYDSLPAVVSGQLVEVESSHSRLAGCDLHLYESTPAKMEALINDVVQALFDVCEVLGTSVNHGRLEIVSGKWLDREEQTQQTVEYVLSIQANVQIVRFMPTAVLQSIEQTVETNELTVSI